jgi:diguanylate cyclase (GGDEF)-like protein
MRLSVTGRHDTILFTGLLIALLVIFQRGLQYGIDMAREIEATYGVALVPALIILSVMFVFHQTAKRREMKAEAAASATEAAIARARAQELEHLMHFGQALSRSLSIDAVREATWKHLPALTEGGDIWVLLKTESGWERMTDAGGNRWPLGELERIADLVLCEPPERRASPEGLVVEGHAALLMLVGTSVLGIVGLKARENDLDSRRKAGAAAALLGVTIRNVQLFAEVRDTSVKDALTGCFNRAHTLEMLDAELARARRSHAALSIVMFDVDQFKRVNDRHGHTCGDAVLAAVGQRLRQVLRKSDVRCRYGGDEFLVMLPDTNESGALRVGEWLRAEMEQIEVKAAEPVPVSISVGVASVMGGDLSGPALVDRADRALYQAKAAGRNCVRSAVPPARSLEKISSGPQARLQSVPIRSHS